MSSLAWHFLAARNGVPVYRDGAPAIAGEWQTYDGPIVLCQRGLHASPRAIDALKYAPSSWASLCEIGGRVVHDTDKIVCSRRKTMWIADATDVLWLSARLSALDVLHLWDAPQIVRDFLETGDDTLRAAARAATWDTAGPAARSAAWDTESHNQRLEGLLMELAP